MRLNTLELNQIVALMKILCTLSDFEEVFNSISNTMTNAVHFLRLVVYIIEKNNLTLAIFFSFTDIAVASINKLPPQFLQVFINAILEKR